MYAFNNEILESFSEINREIYKLIKKDADRVGLTVVQLKTLYRLLDNPDSSLSDLAEKLRLTNSTVSGVIDRLVQHELVDRVVPPENRRAVSIHLTKKGEEIIESVLASPESLIIQRINSVMALPEEEIKNLLRLHALVRSRLSMEEE
ncbi:MarR family winged helix-turn-helix transcriptional regulator [Neobacillus terrae]|uniref:MarR family winged helix-turn-helix transcriptional regulator n=1 Tax=Neobacillus terrae TaxID=3034837 RepID=UPI00140D29E4|nr:MarR family transcriptional regulator [Neobacillus terrae]NHM29443.1 MarR family transcriptional regulator [Neobacillus terrae]